jgi:hypothetical protein
MFMLLSSYAAAVHANDNNNCAEEFTPCVTKRDCCSGDDLDCTLGDWAVTTDSACLSKRSVHLNALRASEKMAVLRKIYANQIPGAKSDEEITGLAEKYIRRDEFAQLIVRLERKYKIIASLLQRSSIDKEL